MPVASTIRATIPSEGWQIPVFKKLSDGYVEEVPNPIWEYHKYIPYLKPNKVHDQIQLYGSTVKDLDDFCLKAQLVNYIIPIIEDDDLGQILIDYDEICEASKNPQDFLLGSHEFPVVTFALENKNADVHPLKFELSLFETQVLVNTPAGIQEISSGLLGRHNILAGVAVGITVGTPLEDIAKTVRLKQAEASLITEEVRAAFVFFKSSDTTVAVFTLQPSSNPTQWITEPTPQPHHVYRPFFSESSGCYEENSIQWVSIFSSSQKLDSKISFMTDHCLLQLYMTERNLSGVSCIIVDEAHEMSVNTDLLLALIKNLLCCGFASKVKYMFGRVSMKIKLVLGDSAGTVTAFYMNSDTNLFRDKSDFEFLGNQTGQPYTVQKNVYAHGKADREQRVNFWFDPAADFHTYTILWNHHHNLFYIEGVPIRGYNNNEAKGIPYLKTQGMRVFSILWEADNWATRGGLEKIDWSKTPFYSYYEDFDIKGCAIPGPASCVSNPRNWWEGVEYQSLMAIEARRYRWVRMNHIIYDYCQDKSRYPITPPDCYLSTTLRTRLILKE